MSQVNLKLYNTRSKTIENFDHDIKNPVKIYTCGPTVYNRAHIGNLKTFMWSDFIVCYLQAIGYNTNHIMNITDIDDKIINSLEKQDLETLIKFTTKYTDLFLEDIKALGIRSYTSENIHKVSDNIEPIVNMIQKLLDLGYAYRVSDGSIYFDVSKVDKYPFPDFQKTILARDDDYVSERKIIKSEDVKSKNDFVLWKSKKEGDIYWDTSIGKGVVSWNSECSGIFLHHLQDVHIAFGGCDLTFPHHTNSIILAEHVNPDGVYGKYSLHSGFLNFSGDKMSKSLGNILKLTDVKHNYYLFRLYVLSKSYRHNFDYSELELEKMKTNFINFHMLYNKLKLGFVKNNVNPNKNYHVKNTYIYDELLEIISNDFDTKNALIKLFAYVDKLLNVYMDSETSRNVLNELDNVNRLFNILDKNVLDISDETLNFIVEREELRKLKQFERSDLMRTQLLEKYFFEDEQTGYLIINKI
jgi:cysteinyl-tRNA synthetase